MKYQAAKNRINVRSRPRSFRSDGFQINKINFLILAVSILADTLLVSMLSPYTVLTAPTIFDAISESLPVVLTASTIIASIAVLNNIWYARAIAVLSSVVKLVCTIQLIVDAGSILNLLTVISIASLSLIASFITCAVKSNESVFENSKTGFSAMSLMALLELAKLLYLTSILKPETFEDFGFAAKVSMTFYTVCLALILAETNTEPKTISVELKKGKYQWDKKYSIALLTVSGTLLWIPQAICFSNCLALSNSFIALSICFSLGALIAFAIDRIFRLAKLKIKFNPDLKVLLAVIATFSLSFSKWFPLSALLLAFTGALLLLMLCQSISNIVSKAQNPAKIIILSMTAIILISFASTALLMNSTSYLPPVYVFRSIGLGACLTFILVALAFRTPRSLALKIYASLILNRKGNTKLLERMYTNCKSAWLVSKLSLTKSILIANFLETPLVVISNDGFLNLLLTQKVLALLDVKIYTHVSEAKNSVKLLHSKKRIPILYFQKLKAETSIENVSFLERRRKRNNIPFYTIESKFDKREADRKLTLNAVPAES